MARKNKPLRVGFDLDGVLLYNPARTIRPIITTFKRNVLQKKKTQFYYPTGKWEQEMFRLFHKSSLFTAGGIDIIRSLVDQGKIEAWIITARFDYLKPDIDAWLDKKGRREIFVDCFHNKDNEQPHYFKEKMIDELDLDVFVEDNWDIVSHLKQTFSPKDKEILWITNLIDMHFIDYPYTFLSLTQAMYHIVRRVSRDQG